MTRTILTTVVPGVEQWPITVETDGRRFRVTYGADVDASLTEGQAAKSYGDSVFHALRCAGLIDGE